MRENRNGNIGHGLTRDEYPQKFKLNRNEILLIVHKIMKNKTLYKTMGYTQLLNYSFAYKERRSQWQT